MPFSIRLIETTAEIEACARLLSESEPWITLQQDYARTLRTMSNTARERYVAMDGDHVAGLLILNLTGALAGYLQTICVAPAYRGRGVGTEIMRFAEDRIFREHANVFLFASSFNPAAMRFYERLGYTRVGEVPNYLVEGHSEILMRKTKGPAVGYAYSSQPSDRA
jgi:ribosomal protein S18 acetylase RimI-like enzyme